MATKQQRFFDIEEESSRIKLQLEKLRTTQQPGEISGPGTKMVILKRHEAEISALFKSGYTVQQIASALSSDKFGILPKSITQLLNARAEVKKKPTTAKKQTSI